MSALLRVLLVEDSEDDALLMLRELQKEGWTTQHARVDTDAALRDALERQPWDVALLDYVMPRFSALTGLQIIRQRDPDLPCILVSGKITDEVAIEAMKAGAHDFVAKDKMSRLPQVVTRETAAAFARRSARVNEVRLRAIVETAADGILTIDEHGIVDSMNPAAAQLLGYTPEEVLGRNVSMLMPEPYHSEHQGYVERYVRTGEARIIGSGRDVEARRKDGSVFPIRLAVSEARLGDRRIFTGIIHDISDRRRAEANYRAIFDAANDAIFVHDLETGAFLDANRRATEMYGYTAGEIRGLDVEALSAGIPPYTQEQALLWVRKAAMGEPQLFEWLAKDRTDRQFWVEVSLRRAAISDQERLLAVVRDITERKRAEERLRFLAEAGRVLASSLDYEETLQRVTHLALPMLADNCVLDVVQEDGAIRRVVVAAADPAKQAPMEELRRYPPDPSRPYGVPQVLRTGQPLFLPQLTDDMLAAFAQDEEHFRVLRGLGNISAVCVPLLVHGRVVGAFTLGVERRRYDQQDLALAEELAARFATAIENARLYRAAERARALAEEANRAKDEFLALISHELRNPLNAITAGVHLLGQFCAGEARAARALEVVERNTALQTRLITDLLDLSRLQRGTLALQRAPVALGKLVAAACRSYEPEARDAGLTFTCDQQPGLWVYGDSDRLHQAVTNLLSNAIKFTPPPGNVRVTCRAPDARHACIVVEDTGIGICPELLPHLFETFRQGEIQAQHSAGLGLGLSLVKGIVEQHGGRVWAESEGIGRGSRFVVELPLVSAPARQAGARHPAPARPTRLLVVEDNTDTRTMVAEGLALAGYEVATARSGEEALQAVAATPPDVMLVDLGLPGINGFEFLRQARVLPDMAEAVAFALTAYAGEEDVRRGREAGFVGHFAKPVDPAALDRRIREWLDAAAG